jgi:DNA polymerase-3 subunit epsilon
VAPAPAEIGRLEYLALLDHALLDRHISVAEANALVAVATEFGISRATAIDLHRAYLTQMASADRQDLSQVAELLGLTEAHVDHALLKAGDEVVAE